MSDDADDECEMTFCDFCATEFPTEFPTDESYDYEGAVLCADCWLSVSDGTKEDEEDEGEHDL